MNAVSERYMPVRCARDVEALRLRELPGVAVGRGQPGEDHLVLWNAHARDSDLLLVRAHQTPDR